MEENNELPDRLPGGAAAVLALFGVVLLIILGWHVAASWLVLVTRDPGTSLDTEVWAGATAQAMEPWNPAMRSADGYGRSQKLYFEGHYPQAVDAMAEAYRDAIGDPDMLAYFRHIQEVMAVATNRKAHLQHGHEGPNGTLKPSDIER